jgi:ssRNA-specific RNase YbeY (16S rRNA maturation enzyme)
MEKDQDDKTKKETLLHEAVHAMLFITGMDQKLSESENEMHAQLWTAFYHDMEKNLK